MNGECCPLADMAWSDEDEVRVSDKCPCICHVIED